MTVRLDRKEGGVIQALRRADRVLRAIAAQDEVGVRDLSRAMGLPKTTIHRLLSSLEAIGYVERDPATRRYRLSVDLFALAAQALARLGLTGVARPIMVELANATDETVYLGVRTQAEIIYVERVASSQAVQMQSGVGSRSPLHATAGGKALLAWLTPEERREILGPEPFAAVTPATHTTHRSLEADLEATRTRGYSFDNGERFADVRSVGAPVRDLSGRVIAALTVAGPAHRFPEGRVPELGARVRDAATAISRRLGCPARPPTGPGG